MKNRLSNRHNITLPPQLMSRVSDYQKASGQKLSIIIQEALRDWLAKQSATQMKQTVNSPMADKYLDEFVDPQLAAVLSKFEAGRGHQHNLYNRDDG